MKKLLLICGIAITLLCFYNCGGNDGNGLKDLPKNFNSMSDSQKVAWMMEKVTPDSLARFLFQAALGRIPGVKIDTLAMATLYAYENYKDSALIAFSDEYDRYPQSLSLPDRMKVYIIAGRSDPMGLGYSLGLEYVNQIRENQMSTQQIDAELKALKEVCGTDTMMFDRFMKGFRVALKVDHGHNLPESIYNKYIQD